MGLMDALLLDPAPFEAWVAYRTDGIAGSGTASDPWNGSPHYAPAVSISGLNRSGLVATATVPAGHGMNNLDVVTITGVTGAGSDRWNGTFIIFNVGATTMSYQMTGEPVAVPSTPLAAQAAKVMVFRFDTVMSSVPERTRVHLGPTPTGLPFLTRGYSDEVSGGWQIKAGVRITGAGVDLTSVRLVGSSSSNAQFFAFAHALTTGSPAAHNPLDFFEISDVTVDCNQMIPPGANIAVACGAARVMGNHAKIRRVKAINWGTNHASRACQVLSVITGNHTVTIGFTEVVGCGIEGCLVTQPFSSPSGAIVTALHAGGTGEALTVAEAYGKGPFIRNCFVDGLSPTGYGETRGLSMSRCRGGVVEGNQVYNVTQGFRGPDNNSAREVIVRHNFFKNVSKGVYWNAKTHSLGLSIDSLAATAGNPVATATMSQDIGYQVGDRIKIVGAGTPALLQGVFTIVELVPNPHQFKYRMSASPQTNLSDTHAFVIKVFGTERIVVERNSIELAPGGTGQVAIEIKDNGLNPQTPAYVHGDVIIRDNQIRYVDSLFEASNAGYGIEVSGAKILCVRNNIVECAPTNPVRNNAQYGAANYFNNKTPDGILIQGWNSATSRRYDELETEVEDAFILAYLER